AVGLVINAGHAGSVQQGFGLVDLGLGEGVILRGIGNGRRSWTQGQDPLRIADQVVLDRSWLDEEDGAQAALEDVRSAARRFGKRVAVAIYDGGRRDGQLAGEWTKHQIHPVDRDQVLVIGLDLLDAAGVVDVLHIHVVTQQAAPRVDVRSPE